MIHAEAAKQILVEAKSGGFFKADVPDDEGELLRVGQFYYEQAKAEFAAGMRNNTVQSIIWIGDTAELETKQAQDKTKDTYPRRSSGGLSESDEREVDNFFEREHLPLPHQIEGDAEPMPRDLSNATDKEIRRLSSEYNAFHSRTTYLLSAESAALVNAEHLLSDARARALRELNTIGPDKKQKLAKVIEAEIAADPEVADLEGKVARHQERIAMLKGLKEIYSGNVSVLSREWTMRQNEWEKSR